MVVVIPLSGSCDQSFSTLKLMKTYLRSTMKDDGLHNLGVLSTESRRVLILESFADQLTRNHQNCRTQLL